MSLRIMAGTDSSMGLPLRATAWHAAAGARGRRRTRRNSTGRQGSALLTSMSAADCFIVLPAAWGRIAADTVVEVRPFYGLI